MNFILVPGFWLGADSWSKVMAPPPLCPTRTTGSDSESTVASTASTWSPRVIEERSVSRDSSPGNVRGCTTAELARIKDFEIVDLPTGHWPQFTCPADLARAILAAVDR